MKLFRSLTALLVSLCLMTGCVPASDSTDPIVVEGFFFDTVISVSVDMEGVSVSGDELRSEVLDLCAHYENLLSRTVEGSDVSRINSAGGAPVEVDPETAGLISLALSYCADTQGLFDITIAPVSSLWDFSSDEPALPDPSAIGEALPHVNYRNVVVDGSMVQLLDPEAAIDLGAIAKGFIADRIRDLLFSLGVQNALINLGGNVVAMGKKEGKTGYRIGIQKPFAARGTLLASIDVSDMSVVTSGPYERSFTVGDTLYHHILDTKTGYPVENGLASVTILAEDSVTADALSTSLYVLGYEKGTELLASVPGTYALFCFEDGSVAASEGLEESFTLTLP